MSSTMRIMTRADWQSAMEKHQERLRPVLAAHLERASHAQKHPAYDFLFEYYMFRPGQLARWSPGWGTLLEGPGLEIFSSLPGIECSAEGARIALDTFPRQRQRGLNWMISLLEQTLERPPRLGCLGLHEWAMVYDEQDVRHPQLPLRLSHQETRAFLESQRVTCSHYDAFRFFSEQARSMNQLTPTRDTQLEHEQCGCLHANMDLYKWAYKFYPWTPSDLIADAFLLAAKARQLDMQASPYDVTQLGWDPVCIETEKGRQEYARRQEELAEASQPIRRQLLHFYRALNAAL